MKIFNQREELGKNLTQCYTKAWNDGNEKQIMYKMQMCEVELNQNSTVLSNQISELLNENVKDFELNERKESDIH